MRKAVLHVATSSSVERVSCKRRTACPVYSRFLRGSLALPKNMADTLRSIGLLLPKKLRTLGVTETSRNETPARIANLCPPLVRYSASLTTNFPAKRGFMNTVRIRHERSRKIIQCSSSRTLRLIPV